MPRPLLRPGEEQLSKAVRHSDVLAGVSGADIFEGFAGAAEVSRRSRLFNLRALQPADSDYGWDLKSAAGRRLCFSALYAWLPLVVILGFPCTHFSILNRNVNYFNRPDELARLQQLDRPFLTLTRDTARVQYDASVENPPQSQAWHEPEILEIVSWPGVSAVIGHMCQYDAMGKQLPIRKALRWASNSPELLAAVSARCPGDHRHEKVEGSVTRGSQTYTPALADAILTATKELARRRDLHRFNEAPDETTYQWTPPREATIP